MMIDWCNNELSSRVEEELAHEMSLTVLYPQYIILKITVRLLKQFVANYHIYGDQLQQLKDAIFILKVS